MSIEDSIGTIKLKIIEAHLVRDTELFSEMDPYVVIYNNETHRQYKTKVVHEGGKHPIWNQSFDIQINSKLDVLELQCMDEDLIYDALVGEGSV